MLKKITKACHMMGILFRTYFEPIYLDEFETFWNEKQVNLAQSFEF